MQNHKPKRREGNFKLFSISTVTVNGRKSAGERLSDDELQGYSRTIQVQVGVDNSAAGLHTVFDIPVDIPIESVESESYVMTEEILVQTGPEAALGDEGDNILPTSPPPPPPPAKRLPTKRNTTKNLKPHATRRKYMIRSVVNLTSKFHGNSKEPIEIE
nr:hypothetical protein Iba_chr14eCG3530 [Ipomoea batatas]